jgi:hypothetical protein
MIGLACAACVGAAEAPLIDGARLGVLVLLAVLIVVQGGFISFFVYLRKRARRMAEMDLEAEWSDLQRGTRTS